MSSDFKLIKASVVHARRGRACAAVLVLGGWIALYVLFEELSAYLRMLKHLQVHVYTLCLHVGPSLGRLYSGCSRTRLFPTAPARLPRPTARTIHSDDHYVTAGQTAWIGARIRLCVRKLCPMAKGNSLV